MIYSRLLSPLKFLNRILVWNTPKVLNMSNVCNNQPRPTQKKLKKNEELKSRLVWVDLEMTGLDLDTCHIIEMACLITDQDLNIVAEVIWLSSSVIVLVFHLQESSGVKEAE